MAYGYAYALLGDAHLAEDAAQEAFIVAWRRLEDIRNPDAFPGWLRSVVRTQCDRMTRGKRLSVVPLEEAANVCTAAPGADTRMETEEARTSVFQALRALPEGERIATTLYYVDGYTQKEIACFLRINPATVSTRLYSARKQLKGRLARMVPSDVQGNRPSRDGAFVRSVHEYLQQFADDSQRADRTLLDAARERLNQLEGRDDWLPEEARAALDVCVHTGRQDRGNDIVRRYLKQRLPVEEEAWARQNLTAGYAVCREFASAVEEHRRFLAWARASLPPDRWAWVFNNGTSANCWIQQNVGQDWISTYREILDVVPAVPGNREDRWHLLRTAGHVFGDLGDAEGVADAAERTRLVADECESEEAALKIRMEAATMVVNFHAKAGP